MNIKKIMVAVAAITIASGFSATCSPTFKETKASDNEHTFLLDPHRNFILDRLASRMGENRSDWNDFLYTWANDEGDVFGFGIFEGLNLEEREFIPSDINYIKDCVYFDYLLTDYMFDVRADHVDELRCLLDHYMQMKDHIIAIFDYSYIGDCDEETLKDLFKEAKDLYDMLKVTIDDTFSDDYFIISEFFVDMKDWLKSINSFVASNKESDIEIEAKQSIFEKLFDFTGIPSSSIGEIYDDYTNIKENDSFFEDYKNSIVGMYGGTDKVINSSFLFPIFYLMDTFGQMENNSSNNTMLTEYIFNNAGPVSYKILDCLEAIREYDEPNALILGKEIIEDTNLLLQYYDECSLTLLNNVYPVTAMITSKWELLNNTVSDYESDEIDLNRFISDLTNVSLGIYSIEGELANMDDVPDFAFLRRKTDELTDCYNKYLYKYEKEIVENVMQRFLDSYYDIRDNLDSLIENSKESDSFSTSSYTPFKESFLTQISELISLENRVLSFMTDLNLDNATVFGFYASICGYREKQNVTGKNILSDYIAFYHNKISQKINEFNLEIETIMSFLNAENDTDFTSCYNLARNLLDKINEYVVNTKDYKTDLEEDEVIVSDINKLTDVYNSASSLITSIQSNKKEKTILSLVDRGNALSMKVENVTNGKNASEHDELIESMNSIVQEINDNYEILDSDTRLLNLKNELLENIEIVELSKANIPSGNLQPGIIVLIVIAGILGAALFFVGGFFLSKILSKKAKTKESK